MTDESDTKTATTTTNNDNKEILKMPEKPNHLKSAYQLFVSENKERLMKVEGMSFIKAGAAEWKITKDKASWEAKFQVLKTTKYAEEEKAYKEAMKEFFAKGGVVPKKEIPLHGDVPLARVKKICKLDTDIKSISSKGYSLIAKASTLFVANLASRTYETQVRPRGTKTIQLKDLASCIHRDRKFRMLDSDFALPDLTKRKKMKKTHEKKPVIEAYPGTQKFQRSFIHFFFLLYCYLSCKIYF